MIGSEGRPATVSQRDARAVARGLKEDFDLGALVRREVPCPPREGKSRGRVPHEYAASLEHRRLRLGRAALKQPTTRAWLENELAGDVAAKCRPGRHQRFSSVVKTSNAVAGGTSTFTLTIAASPRGAEGVIVFYALACVPRNL
jgi:hypothetical protein